MNVSDLAEDYLVDPKAGMRKLTASLLNEVMELEAEKQIQARPYERTGKEKSTSQWNKTAITQDYSRGNRAS